MILETPVLFPEEILHIWTHNCKELGIHHYFFKHSPKIFFIILRKVSTAKPHKKEMHLDLAQGLALSGR